MLSASSERLSSRSMIQRPSGEPSFPWLKFVDWTARWPNTLRRGFPNLSRRSTISEVEATYHRSYFPADEFRFRDVVHSKCVRIPVESVEGRQISSCRCRSGSFVIIPPGG